MNTHTSSPARVSRFGWLLVLLLAASVVMAQAPGQRVKIDRRTISPNRPAPELYADKLALKLTLINLPGASEPSSSWQLEYKVYFVAEQDFERVVKQLNKEGKGRELSPEDFPTKILLADGQLNKRKLSTLPDRTLWRQGIDFKSKIPLEQQTAFASIMCFYSVKIYDAKLKKNVYGSDVFVVPPFDTNTNDRENFTANTTLYLNFYVADDGALYKSNRKSASEITQWRPN